MDKELTNKLKADFPQFFSGLGGSPRKTMMAFGLECGNGWYDLIYKLCERIKSLNPSEQFVFMQVKEKFGGLRVYADYASDEIYDAIDLAEQESYKICETCGAPAKVSENNCGWIRTRCEGCE